MCRSRKEGVGRMGAKSVCRRLRARILPSPVMVGCDLPVCTACITLGSLTFVRFFRRRWRSGPSQGVHQPGMWVVTLRTLCFPLHTPSIPASGRAGCCVPSVAAASTPVCACFMRTNAGQRRTLNKAATTVGMHRSHHHARIMLYMLLCRTSPARTLAATAASGLSWSTATTTKGTRM